MLHYQYYQCIYFTYLKSHNTNHIIFCNIFTKKNYKIDSIPTRKSIQSTKMEGFWKPTIQMFQSLIEKPKMAEWLLLKPPFKYIFDIIMQTFIKTNFAPGLYTGQQNDAKYYDSKEKKIIFLRKIITLIEKLSGKAVEANPLKIVAGLQPEKTNLFLQAVYKAATDKQKHQMDMDLLIQQINSNDIHSYTYLQDKNKYDSKEPLTKIVIFDLSKQQTGNPVSNLKKFVLKYKHQYKIGLNKEPISYYSIIKTHLFIIAGPKQQFSALQIANLNQLIDHGERILVMTNEGGDRINKSNLNAFTQLFGISINNDAVKGKQFKRHFYQKQNNEFQYINDRIIFQGKQENKNEQKSLQKNINIIYPNGTSLTVQPPSYPIISCVSEDNQNHYPVVAVHVAKSGGRLMVCGSVDMFSDDGFCCLQNLNFMDFAMEFLLTNNINFQFSQVQQKEHGIEVKTNKNQQKDQLREAKMQIEKKMKMVDLKGEQDQISLKPSSDQEFYEKLQAKGICDITIQILRSSNIKSFQDVKYLKEEDTALMGIQFGQIIMIRKVFSQ